MSIKYARKVSVTERTAFVDGATRSGKGLTCRFLSYLSGGEHWQYRPVLEHICYMHQAGAIDIDVAAPFFQFMAEESILNRMFGRDLNTRLSDESSIFKSPDPGEFIRRSVTERHPEILEDFNAHKRLPIFDLHSCLPSAKLIFQGMPWAKIIHVNRHPIDLTYKWISRGWGHRETSDPLSFVTLIEHPDGAVPWFASDWANRYNTLSPAERALEGVLCLEKRDEQGLDEITPGQRKQVLQIPFEKLVTESHELMHQFADFFNAEIADGFEIMLLEERCPRIIDPAERLKWLDEIAGNVSADALDRLRAAGNIYDKKWLT